MISIREATLDDIEALLVMEQGVVEAEREFDPTLKNIGVKYYDLEGLIRSEESLLLVATTDSKIVASGYVKILESKDHFVHKKYGYQGFMYVDPEQRGKKLISRIIQGLNDWCQSKGVYEIRLDVYAENQSAIKAYKRMNFQERMIEMRLNLKE